MENDVVEEYKSSLSDLNCNSKPMINALTIIAEENIKFAPQVVQVIENHINNAGVDLKLPVLYLIDSIMKNVGRDYLSLFSERIVSVFSSVFEKVDEKTRVLLYKLRQTWTEIMPNKRLYAIDVRVNQMDPAWPITSQPPVKSIHINPKFLGTTSKKPEESVSVKETEAKRKAQEEVLKQLLAKQERIRRITEEAKEPEKKNNASTRPTISRPPKSSETAPAERRDLQKLDPRIAQRDPRLKRAGAASSIHKGLDEDKSVKNVSPGVQNQQESTQKHSSVPSIVVSVPSTLQSQEVDVAASPKNDKKSENSSDSTKKKTDKSTAGDAKSPPSEQAKPEESKLNSVKRFPSPQKLSGEPPQPPEIQDKALRGQDSSRKIRTEASPGKNKNSAAKEKPLSTDSKHPSDGKSSAAEKSKLDIKDPHTETVKHIGRPSKGSPQTLLEADKESETCASRSRSKGTTEDKKASPRHRSRSPLLAEDKKKDTKPTRAASRSARHLPIEKRDEKVESSQESAVVKSNIPPDDFPKVDTDLRVSSRSSVSPEKSVKGNKRESSSFKDAEDQENMHEPPVKKAKDDKENDNTEDVSWFGNQDQDYRCKERENKINNHQGWAQYKAVHPDEFKSPLRPARENMENIGPTSEDFREAHDKLLPKHSQPDQRMYGGGPSDPGSECDRLGRPRLHRRRSYEHMRFRGRYGRRYDHPSHHENFYCGHSDKGYDVSMLSNPQFIIRQAEERLRSGLINEDCFRDIREGLQKMMDSARKLGIRMPNFNVMPMYPVSKFHEQTEFPGSRMMHINKSRGFIPPPQVALRPKGPRSSPPSTCSFALDGLKCDIHFIDDKAIVMIDDVPKQIVLRGPPTQVFIEGMNPITVKFDGIPVRFEVDGKMHTVRFGVPTRELYVDDYPYEGKFGGPSFFVNIDGKRYSVRLGKNIPEVVFLDEPQHELYKKFLEGICGTNQPSNARMSPISEKNMEGSSTVSNFSIKAEDTDFRSSENERTASSTISGPISSDIDMRTVKIKKEPVDGESTENFGDSEYADVAANRNVSDMKDVDWRCHPLPVDSAPPAKRENNSYPPPSVDFAGVKDSCRPPDAPSDSMLHPGHPRNQIIHSDVETKFRNTFTDATSQMQQNMWNGPMSRDSLDDRTQNNSEWHEWESSQDRVMPWQESGPRHPQLPVQPRDRPLPRIPNMPNWRGGRFTPPYAQNEPAERILPPRVITSQQPNWRQPLENLNEGNPNMPSWEWKQRNFQPDVPPIHSHPPDQGRPYTMQRNDSKPPFENYRGPYEQQLPPPPMPPRGPLHLMGNQLRPELPVALIRPTIPGSDLRNTRPLMPHQRQWLPRNHMENIAPSIRERPLIKFLPPVPTMSGLPSNPQLRTSLPPPPLPPSLPNISVSLQGPLPFNIPRVPSPVVSEVSNVEPVTSQAYVPSFAAPEVQIKTEIVDTSSSQESLQAVSTGSQQFTPQAAPSATSQESSVNVQITDPPGTTNDVASSSSAAVPNVLDLSSLMERLIAAGIITTKPSQAEKMEVEEPEVVKSEIENTDKEEPTPPIEFSTESLKGRYSGVISALFRGTQCASCGMRFKDTHGERYKRHLDWHFRVNRREKDGAKKAFSRKWYYDVEDWIQFEEFEDFEERARSFFELQADEELLQAPAAVEVPTVPAAHGNETEVCVVCGEAFQLLWVEEEEEWHLKDAVREDGQPYHPLCFEDFKKASEVPDTPVEDTPSVDISATTDKEEEMEADKDTTASAEDTASQADIKTESENVEETKEENEVSEKQNAEDASTVTEEETVEDEQEPAEEEPLEGKPGEEEIIGVITESDMEEEKEPPKESKMVVLQSGGIVMKVRAESIQQPASPAPAAPPDKDADKREDSEEEFRPPTPDPRFKVLPPVKKGTELSGLCTIM